MKKLYMWIAWKLPKELVTWVFIRVVAEATTGKYSNQEVPALTCITALKRWNKEEE